MIHSYLILFQEIDAMLGQPVDEGPEGVTVWGFAGEDGFIGIVVEGWGGQKSNHFTL